MSNTECDIAVVGCGPTGAALANLLALSGVQVAVFERSEALYPLPRAVHFDDECMRLFQTLGISGALSERVRVNPGMRFVDDAGTLLLDWPRPQQPGPQGWHASYRLHQPDLEQLLRQALHTAPHATLHTGQAVTAIEQSPDRVSLDVTDTRTGRASRCVARYAVGCDGAHSTVREAMGAGYHDLGFAERWLVVDLLLKRERPDLGDHTLQYCNPDYPATYCRNPGKRRRWEFRLDRDEGDADATAPAALWTRLSRWVSTRDADIERAAVYTFRSALATQWQTGRLLLAGDAAHLTPPFMGQGMCAGLRDAANLAWKLAHCVADDAAQPLLATYEAERAPHARAYIDTAMRLGGLINAADQDGALELAESGSRTLASLSRRLGGVPENTHPAVGQLMPQPTLADGRRLDDAVGYAPALLTREAMPGAHAHNDIAVFDGDTHPDIGRALDTLGVHAVRVRPDRYACEVARDAETVTQWLR